MKLITKAIEKAVPALYSTEREQPAEVVVHAKFFDPCGRYTFFLTEYDAEQRLAFGYCISPLGGRLR